MKFEKPQVLVLAKPPELNPKNHLIIFDEILSTYPEFTSWIESYPMVYGVKGGEPLKDYRAFPDHMSQLLEQSKSCHGELRIVAVGGGSVGDFSGFVASVFKRGVPFVQIPTTWLSAIDSAHGGKTALNCDGVKNQIGSFHFASEVYLVQSFLSSNNKDNFKDALGELAKTALYDQKVLSLIEKMKKVDETEIIHHLPDIIDAKYRVVEQDPFEQKDIRQILNLGHTLAHILEPFLNINHGRAVAEGLFFSLSWSLQRNYLDEATYNQLMAIVNSKLGLHTFKEKIKIDEKYFMDRLEQDKKRNPLGGINFVFVTGRGEAAVKAVSLTEMANEARRQGYLE